MRIATIRVLLALASTAGLGVASGCGSSHSTPTAHSSPTTIQRPTQVTTPSGSVGQPAGCAAPGSGLVPGRENSPPGDIPDTQAYVAYSAPTGPAPFTVQVPEGWAQTAAAGGQAVSFTDKLNTIGITVRAAPSAPTPALVQARDIPTLQAESTCPTGIRVTTASRTAGPAVLITYQQNSPADPVTGKVYLDDVKRYLFWKSGFEAAITLTSPSGADNVDPWRRVTDSFRWVG